MYIRKAAFTLVELLTVIAILAILMAMTGAMVANAKSDAKKATCMFNLRQMGVGISEYVIDFDDRYPQTKGHSTDSPGTDDASGAIELPDRGSPLVYLGRDGAGIATCPSDPDPDDENCSGSGPVVYSYLVNGYFVWGLSESGVRSTSSTIYLAERRSGPVLSAIAYCDVIYRPWYNPSNGVAPQDDMDSVTGAIGVRHFDGSNYEFVDGHAAWKKYGQTWSPANNIDLHTP